MKTKPGRKSGCTVWLMVVPKMFSIGTAVVTERNSVSGVTVRVATSSSATIT